MHPVNHYACAGFLTLVTNITLTAAVLSKGLYSKTNKYFALSSLAVASYGAGFFLQAISNSRLQSLLAIKLNLLGTIFIPIFFLQMVYVILGKRMGKRLLWGIYGTGIFFEAVNIFTDLLAGSPVPKFGFNYLFKAGPLYPALAVFFLLCMGLILWRLYWGYRYETISLKRNQLKYFFLGGVVGVVGGFPGFALGYNFDFYPVNPYAAYGVPIYCVICAYAILKYGLLGIRATLRMTFAPLAAMAVVGYIAVFCFDRMAFEGKDLLTADMLLLYTLGVIFLFQLVYRTISYFMNKFLPLRQYEDLLYQYAKRLGRCTSISEIVRAAMAMLENEHCPGTFSAVFLWKTSPGQPFVVKGHFGIKMPDDRKVPADANIVKMVNDELIARTDSARRLPVIIMAELNKIFPDRVISKITPEMLRFNAQVCIPLIYREGMARRLVGFLFLGEPIASDVYTGWDYDFFREAAEQTMNALMNAEAHERMGKMERLAYLGNMAMGWGHQLNNILFRISLRGRMITENLGTGIDRHKLSSEESVTLDTAINDADSLINAALQGGEVAKDFLRLTKTLKRKDIEKIDLRAQVDSAVSALRDMGRAVGVDIRNNIPRGFLNIDGIGYCFEEVFKNLIDNGSRAVVERHPDGGGWLSVDVELPEEGDKVVITVKDNGCGMAEEDVAHLGTPLFSAIGKEADGGRHGLGVSVIYYYIMNVHNGDVRVESRLGKGTTFYLTLPIRQDVEGGKKEVRDAKDPLHR